MRNVWTLALGVLLGGTSLVPAQTPTAPNRLPTTNSTTGPLLLPDSGAAANPRLQPLPATEPVTTSGSYGGDDRDNACFWASAEYLLWWVKGGPTPPLVTTGNPADILPPGPLAVGLSSTRVLFGDRALDYGTVSGYRATLGAWLDSDRGLGFEVSGFDLPQRSVTFAAAADSTGNPAIFVPAFRPELGREGAFTIASPVLGVTGSILINAPTQLWGTEINAVASIVRRDGFQMNGMLGFRYMDLRESITISAPNLFDFVNIINESVIDQFSTQNRFYGGQIGAWFAYHTGIFSAELTTKLALGDNHEVIAISGSTTQSGPGSPNPGTFPGGIFTQPTNIGNRSHEQFAVIPEVKVLGGINVLENLRLFVTYDFLYWNQVVRPGAQIDRSVNQTQALGMPLLGPAAPQPQNNRTDFWAQGITCGLELRF